MAQRTMAGLVFLTLSIGLCCCQLKVDMGSSTEDSDSHSETSSEGDTDSDICDDDEFQIAKLAPNMLIMLDRSGTMVAQVGWTLKNRWEVCRDAIEMLTNTYNDEIRFGLATFSSCFPGGCSAGMIQVPIADENAAAVQDFLNGTVGVGSADGATIDDDGLVQYLCESGLPETSTGASLAALVGETTLMDTQRENAVLLLTDGDENTECIQDGMNGAMGAAALLAQDPSVRTFVVGFGGANLSEISAIATAGGTVAPYFTNQPAQLEAAFSDIAQGFLSCQYTIPGLDPSADKTLVNFYFDGEIVPYDAGCAAGTGWTWSNEEMTEVTFCQEACLKIKNQEVTSVTATFGCATVPVE